ncbi:MAG: hypothetical protein L6R41_001698 [Letrouitia leprolyta]|nr:MAG: hypothetical protein L6R41_001698 [Letrouitia leprolyta]
MVYRGKEKLTLEIVLTDGQQDAFIPSYTSLDEIRGKVILTAQTHTKIEQVHVAFEGDVKTYVEKLATSAPTNNRSKAFQPFLRLVQPREEADFPNDNVLEAGKTYSFPFTFAVPDRLLPTICNHPTKSEATHQAHLCPPPTLGDPLTAGWGKSLMDDMAPDMSMISYSIRARITSGRRSSDNKHNVIADGIKKVRIVPTVPEEPPLIVHGGMEDDYKLRKEKAIKKGTFKGRLGTLVMESAQPRSLRLPAPRTENPCAVTTSATVNLRFDPASADAQPPRLGTLATKLKVATFFASRPMSDIPSRSSDFHASTTRGLYVETLPLSSRCVATAQWEKHQGTSPPRRDSVLSTVSASNPNPNVPQPSSSYKEHLPYYTTHLLVPITLPRKDDGTGSSKVFVPTFYSCLASRIYVLDFYLSCQTPGASVTAPTMHLKLPIQISAEGSPDARPIISEGEAQAIARRESALDSILQPRSVAPPSPEYTEQANLLSFSTPSPDSADESPGSPRAESWDIMGRSSGGHGAGENLPPPDYMIRTSGRPNVRSSPTQ